MKYVAAFFFITAATTLYAQPVILKDDFLSMNDGKAKFSQFTSTDMTGLTAMTGNGGANISWTLSNRSWQPGSTSGLDRFNLFPFPGDAPFTTDPNFSSATHISKDTS